MCRMEEDILPGRGGRGVARRRYIDGLTAGTAWSDCFPS